MITAPLLSQLHCTLLSQLQCSAVLHVVVHCTLLSQLQRSTVQAFTLLPQLRCPLLSLLQRSPYRCCPSAVALGCHSYNAAQAFTLLSQLRCPLLSLLQCSPSRCCPSSVALCCHSYSEGFHVAVPAPLSSAVTATEQSLTLLFQLRCILLSPNCIYNSQ
jgi:hypothetical protein